MEMKYLMMIVLFFGVMLQEGMSQTRDSSSCMSKLLPCMNYLNEAKGDPPQSCCNPLKEVIRKMPECLCQMVSIKGSKAAEQAGIDVNEAQMLPAKCGQPVNYMGCLKGASNSAGKSMGITITMKVFLVVVSMILFQFL